MCSDWCKRVIYSISALSEFETKQVNSYLFAPKISCVSARKMTRAINIIIASSLSFFPRRWWILAYRKIEQSVKTQHLQTVSPERRISASIYTHIRTQYTTHPPITCYIVFLILFFSFSFWISGWFFFAFVSSSNFGCNQSLALRRSEMLAQTAENCF